MICTSRICDFAGSSAARLACGLAMLFLVGCQTQVGDSDVDQAAMLLNQALGAWKSGETIDQQRGRSEPVFVAEDLWHSGYKLLEYSVVGPGQQRGTNVCFQVDMNCANPRGRKFRTQVDYIVTTTPACTIAHLD